MRLIQNGSERQAPAGCQACRGGEIARQSNTPPRARDGPGGPRGAAASVPPVGRVARRWATPVRAAGSAARVHHSNKHDLQARGQLDVDEGGSGEVLVRAACKWAAAVSASSKRSISTQAFSRMCSYQRDRSSLSTSIGYECKTHSRPNSVTAQSGLG